MRIGWKNRTYRLLGIFAVMACFCGLLYWYAVPVTVAEPVGVRQNIPETAAGEEPAKIQENSNQPLQETVPEPERTEERTSVTGSCAASAAEELPALDIAEEPAQEGYESTMEQSQRMDMEKKTVPASAQTPDPVAQDILQSLQKKGTDRKDYKVSETEPDVILDMEPLALGPSEQEKDMKKQKKDLEKAKPAALDKPVKAKKALE